MSKIYTEQTVGVSGMEKREKLLHPDVQTSKIKFQNLANDFCRVDKYVYRCDISLHSVMAELAISTSVARSRIEGWRIE